MLRRAGALQIAPIFHANICFMALKIFIRPIHHTSIGPRDEIPLSSDPRNAV